MADDILCIPIMVLILYAKCWGGASFVLIVKYDQFLTVLLIKSIFSFQNYPNADPYMNLLHWLPCRW